MLKYHKNIFYFVNIVPSDAVVSRLIVSDMFAHDKAPGDIIYPCVVISLETFPFKSVHRNTFILPPSAELCKFMHSIAIFILRERFELRTQVVARKRNNILRHPYFSSRLVCLRAKSKSQKQT